VAFTGQGEDMPEQVLQDADTAMYQAKRRRGARHIMDLSDSVPKVSGATLGSDLRGAIGRGELRNDYQPIVRSTDGRVTGVEALLRWDHPDRGLVSPAIVVPLAQQSGLIDEIGRWVLQRACEDRHGWKHAHGDQTFGISVNVSANQLMGPALCEAVAAVLHETGTDPRAVTLEVTESVFIEDGQRALVVLGDLKELGVTVALDDFGVGYASLNNLRHFPIDIAKIDKSLIDALGRDETGPAIVGAIVNLAHALGLSVVTEGVETVGQAHAEGALDCDSCQGYYFARPMSAEDLHVLMSHGTLWLPR